MMPSRAGVGRRWSGALIVLASLAAACGSDGDASTTSDAPDASSTDESEDSDGSAPAAPTESVVVDVGSDEVEVDVEILPVDTTVLGAEVGIDASDEVTVSITAVSGDHVVETPLTAAAANAHLLPLVGLRAERTYDVIATAYDDGGAVVGAGSAAFETGALPDVFPDFTFDADPSAMSPGVTLLEPDAFGEAPGSLLALDADGEVVWYHVPEETVSAATLADNGNLVGVVFFDSFVEFDVLGRDVGRWQLPAEQDAQDSADDEVAPAVRLEIPWEVNATGEPAEVHTPHHDFFRLPDGNYVALARVTEEVALEDQQAFCSDSSEEWNVATDLVIEFEPDGTVVRTWNLTDGVDLLQIPGNFLCEEETLFSTPTERDWTHANAVEYDPATDVLIISSRHTDQLVAFERGTTTGHQTEVAWILGSEGDVPIDGEPFFHPHAPEVQADGSLLVYDNGNFRPGDGPPYSRVVQYAFEEGPDGTLAANQVWEHRMDDVDGAPLYAPFVGDADRLANGNVLIAHGGIGIPGDDDTRVRILEVVPSGEAGGEIVLEVSFGGAEAGFVNYRAERIESFYTGPLWAG